MKQKEILILAGPTGVGKSLAAVELAETLGGEIIGADAFQVYQGMGILTAQPDRSLQKRVTHHLVNCIPPSQSFDAGAYAAQAEEVITAIHGRGKTPIVAGGTGLYIRALTHGLAETPPVDNALRQKLEALPLEELLSELEIRDRETAQIIDRKNRRRVQRALEIVLQTGIPASKLREGWEVPRRPFRGILLTRDREELLLRIDANVRQMAERGIMDELRSLGEVGQTAQNAIGFKEGMQHLKGKLTLEEWIAQTQTHSRQYAKRQLTWFRNQTKFSVLNLSAISNVRDSLIAAFSSPAAQTE